MFHYRLQFSSPDGAGIRCIEFTGFDPSEAFALLEREKVQKPATLWVEDRDVPVATLLRAGDGVWRLG